MPFPHTTAGFAPAFGQTAFPKIALKPGVRLIAAVHNNRNKIYIRRVLTQEEYDRRSLTGEQRWSFANLASPP